MQQIIIALILILMQTACATQTEINAPSKQSSIKNIHGKHIYDQSCLPCHGGDGKGALAGISDLTQVEVFKSDATSDAALFKYLKSIKQGIKSSNGGMSMPPKGGSLDLTDQEIREVLKYMREKFATK